MNAAVAGVPPDCARCGDTRRVWNAFMGKRIRCPACTVRARPRDPVKMQGVNAHLSRKDAELTRPEAERLVRRLDRTLVEALFDVFRSTTLPEHLVATDRILQRWAAAPTGSPAIDEDVYRECRPPPLDDKTQEAVTDCFLAQPHGVRWFVRDWYTRSWLSVKRMAERRRMSRRQLDRERIDVLHAMRAAFLASKHEDLQRLVREAA